MRNMGIGTIFSIFVHLHDRGFVSKLILAKHFLVAKYNNDFRCEFTEQLEQRIQNCFSKVKILFSKNIEQAKMFSPKLKASNWTHSCDQILNRIDLIV